MGYKVGNSGRKWGKVWESREKGEEREGGCEERVGSELGGEVSHTFIFSLFKITFSLSNFKMCAQYF